MIPVNYVYQDEGMRRAKAEGVLEGKLEGELDGQLKALHKRCWKSLRPVDFWPAMRCASEYPRERTW